MFQCDLNFIMKFRLRVIILALLTSAVCLILFIFEPKFPGIGSLEDLSNDYVEVGEDNLDNQDAETSRVTSFQKFHVQKNLFPFFMEADIFNSTVKESVIERFTNWYGIRWDFRPAPGTDLWQVAGGWVTPEQIHGEYVPELGAILLAMSSRPIVGADVINKGSQLKLILTLEGDQNVIFKPQWYSRSYLVEGKPYDGHDRHNGEVVAFHFNRLLGFRKVPLTVGRVVDLHRDILPVATERLRATFFKRGDNTCFYGKCLYCKGESNGVCAKGTRMEGAIVLMLPKHFAFQKYRHPWGRTYIDGRKARWEYDDEHYCADIQKMSLYRSGRLLLDIIDACVFDYIVGNADRHHFEVFRNQSESILIMFDNGKSFGNPFYDEESILTPLKQCKRIRYATVQRLRQMRRGVLSRVLIGILSHDPIAPLLTSHHFRAMERRLEYVVQLIEIYVKVNPDVLVERPSR